MQSLSPSAGRQQVTSFNLKGWEPDTKITVFGKEFRVHSVVLRLYSTFFRGALDAIDAQFAGGASANRFRYNFESVFTNSGNVSEWTLERAIEKPRTPSPSPGFAPANLRLEVEDQDTDEKSLSPRDQEINAFTSLLHAYYSKPYSLPSLSSLETLTRLTTHFGSLPCVSSSLYRALWSFPSLISCIRQNAETVLLLAFRLRHTLLFREALVHVVSQWEVRRWEKLFTGDEHRLVCAVMKARNGVLERLVRVNARLFDVIKSGGGNREGVLKVLGQWGGPGWQERGFYEALDGAIELYETFLGGPFVEGVRELLSCKLVLEAGKGVGDTYEDGLLCAEIRDEDLPWDLDEEDW